MRACDLTALLGVVVASVTGSQHYYYWDSDYYYWDSNAGWNSNSMDYYWNSDVGWSSDSGWPASYYDPSDPYDPGTGSTTVEGQSGSNGEWYAGPGGGDASSSGANSGDDDDDDEESSDDDDEDSSSDNTTAGMVVSTSVTSGASSVTVSTSEPSAFAAATAATVHGTVTVSTTAEGRDMLCLESNLQVGGSTYEAFINALGDVGVAVSGDVDLSCGGRRLSRRLQSESVKLRYSVSFSSTSDAVSFSNDVSFSATAVSSQFESQVASSLGLDITATVDDVSVTLNSAHALTGGSHIPHISVFASTLAFFAIEQR